MSLDLPQKVNGIDGFDVPELISFYYMYVLVNRVAQIVRTIVCNLGIDVLNMKMDFDTEKLGIQLIRSCVKNLFQISDFDNWNIFLKIRSFLFAR